MPTHHVSVRLGPELVARVEAQIPTFSTRWRKATTSDVLRAIIITGLERLEAEQKATKPRKRGGAR